MNANRVSITNNTPAPQGFYTVPDTPAADPTDAVGMEPVFVRPGQTATLVLDDEQLRLAKMLGSGLTIEAVADGQAALALAAPEPLEPSLTPPRDNTVDVAAGAAAAAAAPTPDRFDGMTDDQLRAFITDRDQKAPHHMLGRPKLLTLARGDAAENPAEAAPAKEAASTESV